MVKLCCIDEFPFALLQVRYVDHESSSNEILHGLTQFFFHLLRLSTLRFEDPKSLVTVAVTSVFLCQKLHRLFDERKVNKYSLDFRIDFDTFQNDVLLVLLLK